MGHSHILVIEVVNTGEVQDLFLLWISNEMILGSNSRPLESFTDYRFILRIRLYIETERRPGERK